MLNQTLPSSLPLPLLPYFRILSMEFLAPGRESSRSQPMAQQLRASCSRRELGFVAALTRGLWLNSMVYGRYTTIDDYGYWGLYPLVI